MVFAALKRLWRVVKQNGGVRGSLLALYVRDDLKIGRLVGQDRIGNKYYENNKYFFGRNRWVNYADHIHLDYDASQVDPEWSGWLHYRTDLPPHEDPSRPHYPWISPPSENMTGTAEQYVPWSTTRPKIDEWRPSQTLGAVSRADCCVHLRPPPPSTNHWDKPQPPVCEKPTTVFH